MRLQVSDSARLYPIMLTDLTEKLGRANSNSWQEANVFLAGSGACILVVIFVVSVL